MTSEEERKSVRTESHETAVLEGLMEALRSLDEAMEIVNSGVSDTMPPRDIEALWNKRDGVEIVRIILTSKINTRLHGN